MQGSWIGVAALALMATGFADEELERLRRELHETRAELVELRAQTQTWRTIALQEERDKNLAQATNRVLRIELQVTREYVTRSLPWGVEDLNSSPSDSNLEVERRLARVRLRTTLPAGTALQAACAWLQQEVGLRIELGPGLAERTLSELRLEYVPARLGIERLVRAVEGTRLTWRLTGEGAIRIEGWPDVRRRLAETQVSLELNRPTPLGEALRKLGHQVGVRVRLEGRSSSRLLPEDLRVRGTSGADALDALLGELVDLEHAVEGDTLVVRVKE